MVFALQLAIELHAQNAGLLFAEAFRLLQVGAIELGVVRPFAGPVGARVERLTAVVVAVAPVVFEQVAASLGQHRGAVPAIQGHALDQALLFQLP